MYEVVVIGTPTLGDRSYLVHDGALAFVVDPQRDIDRASAIAEQHGVRITDVFETHIHNDYVTGGYALAQLCSARYHVNADDPVTFERQPISDGDLAQVSPLLAVRAVATPGHTHTHLAFALEVEGKTVGCSPAGRCCTAPPAGPTCWALSTPMSLCTPSGPVLIAWRLQPLTRRHCSRPTTSAASAPATQSEAGSSTIGDERLPTRYWSRENRRG